MEMIIVVVMIIEMILMMRSVIVLVMIKTAVIDLSYLFTFLSVSFILLSIYRLHDDDNNNDNDVSDYNDVGVNS
jgi:hypothetical protein